MRSIPPSDVNIFPEYILQGLSQIAQDEAVIVRAAFAENIAHLAHIALRYLENAHLSNLGNKEGPKPSYDSELQTLHEMVRIIPFVIHKIESKTTRSKLKLSLIDRTINRELSHLASFFK